MGVDINRVLQGGYDRTVARTGLLFVGVFFVLGVGNELLSNDLNLNGTPVEDAGAVGGPVVGFQPDPATATTPSLALPSAVAGVLLFGLAVVSLVVTVGAVRTFVADEREGIPRELFARNLPLAAANLLVGSVAFAVVVGIGFLFFVVPGLFLLVSLFFWEVVVIIDDENFLEGFARSWRLTSGNRLGLFLAGVVVVLAGFLVAITFAVLGLLIPDPIEFLFDAIGGALIEVFFVATVAEAYTQLVAEEDAVGDAGDDGPDDRGTADRVGTA